MAQAQALTVSAVDWCDSVAEILAPAFTVAGALASAAAEVQAGRALAFAVEHSGDMVAAFVLRVEGDEGVVVAAGGRVPGVSLIAALLPSIESRFVGCRAVRFHTARPGLARVMRAAGYVGQEVVMRKDL